MSKKKKKPFPFIKNDQSTITAAILDLFDNNPSVVVTYKSIAKRLGLKDSNSRRAIHNTLSKLAKEGVLKEFVHGQFCLPKNGISKGKKSNSNAAKYKNVVEGVLDFTKRGSAYLIVENEDNDIYINPRNTGRGLDGDRVKVSIIKQTENRTEGKVIEIVERIKTFFVGNLQANEKTAFLIPDNQKMDVDIFIPKHEINGARSGEKVLVKLLDWKENDKSPIGKVVERLGLPGSNDAEMISILVENGIDYQFSQEVIREAEQTPLELDEKEISLRRDFRKVLTFTIDPKDAKDFDDALSLQKLENGNHEIGIHIADVSHYVQIDNAMDEEAQKKGNSVYLVDRVVPMLPEQLSNIACSLRPHEDKYSFSAVFEISESGDIVKEWFGKTVIHSDKRFTYEEAQEIIEGNDDELREPILYLDKLAKKYRSKRLKNGALNIESEEVRFELNEFGQPAGINIKTSKDAHKLIEEFMLLANRKVAEFLGKTDKNKNTIPLLYRVHDAPDIGKIETFKLFINKFGYEINYTSEKDIAKRINQLLNDIRYKNEHSIIQSMAIRSMAKASYETTNIGHYGLAFEHYVHFTSPIRRYADLVVHRILHAVLEKNKLPYSQNSLNSIAKHISKTERQAVDAERSSTKYFQVLFVKDNIGETFEATISGIADFGIFAEMNENKCEGLIPMETIEGDRYYYNVQKYCILGAKHGKSFTFGDKIKVKIMAVDERKRTIDLKMVE